MSFGCICGKSKPNPTFYSSQQFCFYIITDQQLRLQKDKKKAVYVCMFVFIHAQPLIIFWLLSSPIYLATVLYFTKLKNLQTFNSKKKKKKRFFLIKKKKKNYSYGSTAQRESQWSINRSKQWFFSLSRAQIISTYYSKNLNIIQTLSIIFHL